MSNSDASLAGRLSRLSATKPFIVLSLLACMSFAPSNTIGDGSNAYSYENRTADVKVMQLREWVSGYAQNFTGIRYKHAGRSPRTGFDCSGFTNYILQEFDLKVSCSSAMQSTQGERISLDEILPGDLIFFGSKKHIQHVAMVVECAADGIICVHSTSSRGVVVENISTSNYWRPKVLFARDVITGQAKACREIASN
jgi:cell wall-associated NlpC family hydrolase